jgi:hypothetical protein
VLVANGRESDEKKKGCKGGAKNRTAGEQDKRQRKKDASVGQKKGRKEGRKEEGILLTPTILFYCIICE